MRREIAEEKGEFDGLTRKGWMGRRWRAGNMDTATSTDRRRRDQHLLHLGGPERRGASAEGASFAASA
jgi:hypothetical protein